jgi:hypothetical protein
MRDAIRDFLRKARQRERGWRGSGGFSRTRKKVWQIHFAAESFHSSCVDRVSPRNIARSESGRPEEETADER